MVGTGGGDRPASASRVTYVPPPPNSPLRVQPRVLDPYEHQPDFDLPWCGRIILGIIDLVLVPLRLISIILLLVSCALVCKILLIGADHAHHAGDPGFGPMRTWLIRHTIFMFGRPICWSFGLITSIKKHPLARTDRGFLISNHIGYTEILMLVAQYAPSVVAKAEIADYPLIGTIARALQCIFIDRGDPHDRERVRLLLVERGQHYTEREGSAFPPLLIFPEGTTNNGATMLKFQKGIFCAGMPVQAIAVRSHWMWFNAGWPSGSMIKHVFGLLARLYHPMSMTELPLYTPNDAEKADPHLFSDNMCQTLANALLIPVSSKSLYDNPELVALSKGRSSATVHPSSPEPPNQSTPTTTVTVSPEIAPSVTPGSARREGWNASTPLLPITSTNESHAVDIPLPQVLVTAG